jgi:hypothetical protein
MIGEEPPAAVVVLQPVTAVVAVAAVHALEIDACGTN